MLREAVEKGDLPKPTKPDALAGFMLNSWEAPCSAHRPTKTTLR